MKVRLHEPTFGEEEIAAGQHPAHAAGAKRRRPGMDRLALHIEQITLVMAIRQDQRKARRRALAVVLEHACVADFHKRSSPR